MPSGPAVIPMGIAPEDGTVKSVIVPLVVIRPTLFPSGWVNHRLPSGPGVMRMA